MPRFEVGDVITPKKQVKGLQCGHPYKIADLRRGIDGAYDWDDLYLEGIPAKRYEDRIEGQFCEFDFDYYATRDRVGKE